MHITRLFLALLLLSVAPLLRAQAVPYGGPIPLADAKRALAAAQEEARKNNWNVVITIVDTGGHVVACERMDSTQHGSVDVALEKARSAAAFRRSTKVFQDGVAAGG